MDRIDSTKVWLGIDDASPWSPSEVSQLAKTVSDTFSAFGKNPSPGHAWIRVKGPCGELAKGCWPTGGFLGTDPGGVFPEDLDYYTHYIRYRVCKQTCDCIKNAIARIENNPGIYCVLDDELGGNSERHCVTFALEVLSSCGFSFPRYHQGDYIEPNDLAGWPEVLVK